MFLSVHLYSQKKYDALIGLYKKSVNHLVTYVNRLEKVKTNYDFKIFVKSFDEIKPLVKKINLQLLKYPEVKKFTKNKHPKSFDLIFVKGKRKLIAYNIAYIGIYRKIDIKYKIPYVTGKHIKEYFKQLKIFLK